MEKIIGTVKRLEWGHKAWVLTNRKAVCGDCGNRHECCALTGDRRQMLVKVDNALGAQPGDHVVLQFSERVRTKWMLLLYSLPVFGALTGALTGTALWHIEVVTIAATLAGLLIGFWIVRSLAGRAASIRELTPEIVWMQSRDSKRSDYKATATSHGCCA